MSKEEIEIEAKTSQQFMNRLIEMIGPDEKTKKHQMEEIYRQMMFASLAKLVTGKEADIVLTPEIKEGHIGGFTAEIKGGGLEEMAKMESDEIIKACVSQIVHVCKSAERSNNLGALLADILSKVKSEDGNAKVSPEQDAQAAA